jgi:predicted nucleic acid-binding protein
MTWFHRKIMRASPAAALIQEYRRSYSGIGLGDHLIVASALTEGLELAPLNTRHYRVFSDLPG